MRFTTPALLTAIGGVLALAVAVGAVTPDRKAGSAIFPAAVETVTVLPGTLTFRQPGEYLRADRPIDAPLATTQFRGFDIMKFQVSAADYALCVVDDGCSVADGSASKTPGEMPVTGVNYRDATAYAAWLSQATGENWRLPTDAEWAFAAAERFADEALGLDDDDGANPAARWLARYRSEAGKAVPEPEPKPRGHFGANDNGLVDVAGNVWDWTTTCYVRASLNADGTIEESTENCGVRVVGGRHRGYMSHFIRDGKSGGCAAGMAPHNLGIRLIREQASLVARFRNLLNKAAS
jgi:formylglycine-generating enzyme required for sulfatase activity